jgi:hypothetical protein
MLFDSCETVYLHTIRLNLDDFLFKIIRVVGKLRCRKLAKLLQKLADGSPPLLFHQNL